MILIHDTNIIEVNKIYIYSSIWLHSIKYECKNDYDTLIESTDLKLIHEVFKYIEIYLKEFKCIDFNLIILTLKVEYDIDVKFDVLTITRKKDKDAKL